MGKVSNIFIVGTAILGMVLSMGCEETRETEIPKARTKVVSKTIQPPKTVDKKPLPDVVVKPDSGTAQKEKPVVNSSLEEIKVKTTKPEAAVPLTEAQVKREQDLAKTVGNPSLFKAQEKYDTKNRVDPFIPLLTAEKTSQSPQKSSKPSAPKRILTPLEKMDLSQIKLVAVIELNTGFLAMVEEASGKGYEVKIGTYMGRNGGRVTAINQDRLIIKEHYTDYQGKQRERNQEIKFHRNEGGE